MLQRSRVTENAMRRPTQMMRNPTRFVTSQNRLSTNNNRLQVPHLLYNAITTQEQNTSKAGERCFVAVFLRCDFLVICLTTVSVFISLHFQTFWPKWLNFFFGISKTFRSITEKKTASSYDVSPNAFVQITTRSCGLTSQTNCNKSLTLYKHGRPPLYFLTSLGSISSGIPPNNCQNSPSS